MMISDSTEMGGGKKKKGKTTKQVGQVLGIGGDQLGAQKPAAVRTAVELGESAITIDHAAASLVFERQAGFTIRPAGRLEYGAASADDRNLRVAEQDLQTGASRIASNLGVSPRIEPRKTSIVGGLVQ